MSHRRLLLAVLLVGGGVLAVAAAPPALYLGHFSATSPSHTHPPDWESLRFGDNDAPTSYDLVRADSTVVLRARSDDGAAGLITYQRVHLSTHPIIEWRWRVQSVIEKADLTKKSGDDAAARLYVTFDYDGLPLLDRLKLFALHSLGHDNLPTRALNYVWATQLPMDTLHDSPYTDQIMMLPVRSGSTKVGQWVRQRRNVRADYREAFGEAPPPVAGVALMTDTDNTGESTQALYGDIVFRPAPARPGSTATGTPSPSSDEGR